MKNILFIGIALLTFGFIQANKLDNGYNSFNNDSIEKFDKSERDTVKKLNKAIKGLKKSKYSLIPEKIQARLALEDATTISNFNILNYKKAEVIEGAEEYYGVPYYFGGTTKNGIDCSALMLKAYDKIELTLPRTSIAQSKLGKRIKKLKAQPGDLIFFKTSRKNRITHVGLISQNNNGEIKFIHASSSKGVIESSLNESYYIKTYAKIKRILL